MEAPSPLRRLLLGAALAGAAPATLASAADSSRLQIDPQYWRRPRRLRLQRAETGETADTVYWRDGQFVAAGYRDLCVLLRDVRANHAVQMDPALLDILFGMQGYLKAFGWTRPIVVTSGYRSPETNRRLESEGAARNSLHLQGKACDITLPGLSARHLGEVGRYFQQGGVGFYTARNFVHIDSGRVRTWGK